MKNRRLMNAFIALVLIFSMCAPSFVVLAETVNADANYRFYYVANGHIDTAWTWPFQHTAEVVIRDTWNRQISALRGSASRRFTMSAATHYKWLKEYYSVDTNTNTTYRNFFQYTSDLIASGQWGIAGGQMTEPDLNLSGGESFARDGLYAQHIFLDLFDKMCTVAYVPDVFGFSGQFPQYIRKTGMQSFVTTKLNWRSDPSNGALDPGPWCESTLGNGGSNRESDIFWWEGIDGSDVLSYACKYDYVSGYATSDFQGNGANTVFNRLTKSGNSTGATEYTGAFYYDYDSHIRYALGMFGSGDHGGGPSTGTGTSAHDYNPTGTPGIRMATIENYFDDVRSVGANRDAGVTATTVLSNVYRHKGENYLAYHRGTYTSWSRVKKYNRQNEILAETAEKAATLGFWANALENNGSDKVAIGWDRILVNHMHDVLPGSAAPYQYYQTFMNQELAKNLFTNLETNALLALAYRADTTVDDGVPVFVYNPSSWIRNGETTTSVALDQYYPYISVFDGSTELPVTIIENREKDDGAAKISFIAKNVPSLGYKVFKVVGSSTPSEVTTDLYTSASGSTITVGNDNLEFTISTVTGNMPSLINKKDGNRQIFYQTSALQGNSLQYKVDTGGAWPAWDMSNGEFGGVTQAFTTVNTAQTVQVVENTPEKITVKVVQAFSASANSVPSVATRYISLLANSDRIDVHFGLDWQMINKNLKLAFPVNVDAKAVSAEIAYGAMDAAAEVARKNATVPASSLANPLQSNSVTGVPAYAGALGRSTMRYSRWDGARFEQSAHKWFDVSNDVGGGGLSILNDAKYGYDVLRMVRTTTNGCGVDSNISGTGTYVRMRQTIVRSASSAGLTQESDRYQPVQHPIDIGFQEFNYSIYPHAGDWKQAETSQRAHEVCYPMPSFQVSQGAGDGILGKEKSFLSINKTNVKIGAVKNAHDDQTDKNTMIVRVWESNGADTTGVVLTLPSNVMSAKEVNMLEHDYTALDNRDAAYAKTLVARTPGSGLTLSGNTIAFDIDHYEILTLEVKLTPYAGEQVPLVQQQISLAGAFNLKATTLDSARNGSSIDGSGGSIPQLLWADARTKRVDYQGIKFDLGAADANNMVTANGQVINVGDGGYNKVFPLGAGAGSGARSGVFTVNYADGGSVEKEIEFADWKSPLTGWAPLQMIDANPYVYDSIAQVFTHWHSPTRDEMTLDNYLYAYPIDVDEAETIESITLPIASGVKVAAITVIGSPIAEFGFTNEAANEIADEYSWNFSDLVPGFKVGNNIDKQNIAGAPEVVTSRAFNAISSTGVTNTGGEGGTQILANNGSSKVCQGVNATSAYWVMDAGSAVNLPGYVIRGANDDIAYLSRVLDSWIVQGSASASGPWTTISTQSGQGDGWNDNYQYRMWLFDKDAVPAEGYRYYRLQITHAGNNGTALGTSSYTIQFSFFGLVTEYRGERIPSVFRNFSSVVSSGQGLTGGEGANQILTNNGTSKWCGTGVISTNANFVLDAGASVKTLGYVIRGAGDDMNYFDRVLNTWTIEGGTSATGPWTVISEPGYQGSGWTENWQTRYFTFNDAAIPSSGFRYYRLIITRRDGGLGQALSNTTCTMQFSYIGLVTELAEDGALSVRTEPSVDKIEGAFTYTNMNGVNDVSLTGAIAESVTAPVTAMDYTTVKRGLNIKVNSDTRFCYMFNPKDSASAYMAIDLKFSDGTRLKNLGATDQYGIALNPRAQGDGMMLQEGQWNYVFVDLGKVAAGKMVNEIIIGYETNSGTPGQEIEGVFDNLRIYRDKAVVNLADIFDIRLANDTATPQVTRVYAGLYSANGRLLDSGTTIDTFSIPANSTNVVINPDIELDKTDGGDDCYIKVFLWTADKFAPLTKAFVFPF